MKTSKQGEDVLHVGDRLAHSETSVFGGWLALFSGGWMAMRESARYLCGGTGGGEVKMASGLSSEGGPEKGG